MKSQKTPNSQGMLQNGKSGGITDFKLYYKIIAINTVVFHKNRHTGQWKRIAQK